MYRHWSRITPYIRRCTETNQSSLESHCFKLQPDRTGFQSQPLFLRYGSGLPTSLTYIVLSTRGCSPWRPAADMGTVRCKNHFLSLGFSRAGKSAPDTARAAVLYGNKIPLSGRADSRESVPYKEKTTLPGTPADVSEFVCVTALSP